MERKRKIGLVGFFGWGNFGDELFVKVHQQFLSDIADLSPVNDLVERPFFSQSLESVVERHDAFLIGGGDLVIPWSVSDLYWNPAYLKKPVFIVGVGVPTWGGIKDSAVEHYRSFFSSPNVKLVCARDKESARWINKHIKPAVEAEFYPDLVCAMDLPASDDRTKALGVVLRQRKSAEDDFSKVRELCERAKEYGFSIKHIVLGNLGTGRADYEVAKRFAEKGEDIVYSESLDDMCRAISSCKMLASMKFHGTIVATMYGIPSLVMSPTDKSRNFMRMIERKDLLASFGKMDLADRMPRFPVPIPSHSRSYLRKAARRGYDVLRAKLLVDAQPQSNRQS